MYKRIKKIVKLTEVFTGYSLTATDSAVVTSGTFSKTAYTVSQ